MFLILSYNLLILEEVAPNAIIAGFNRLQEAIKYAKENRIDLAFLDIEMGMVSGFDLCRDLLEINPCTKVVYLTAYIVFQISSYKRLLFQNPFLCSSFFDTLFPIEKTI